MKGDYKKLAYLFLVANLIQITIHQQDHQDLSNSVHNDDSTIQFKQGDTNAPHIQFKQTQYTYNPEIYSDYSIVYTDVYPQASSSRQKFILSVGKDSFVNKLSHQNSQITEKNENNDNQKQLQSQKTSNEQKQIQNKAQEILKQQTIEQQAKFQQEKSTSYQIKQNPPKPTPRPTDVSKSQQKINPDQNVNQQASNLNKQDEKRKEQNTKAQYKPQLSKEDFFAQSPTKSHPQIQKANKNIPFKEHQITKPLPITTYPFETKSKPQNTQLTQKQINNPSQNNQQIKKQPTKPSSQQQKTKTQTKQVQKSQTQVENETKKDQRPNQLKKKDVQKPANSEKKQIIVEDKKVDSKDTNKPISENQESAKQGLDPVLVSQFKKLKNSLSVEPQKIKKTVEFERLVKEEIEQSDWKFLIAKVVIGITIMASIYQATCSSESQENKVQRGKYAPLGLNEIDTESSLQMSERIEHR